MPDCFLARQDTGYCKEAGLKNSIGAHAETDIPRHSGCVNDKKAQFLVEDLLLHGLWKFVPCLVLPKGAVKQKDAACRRDPQQVLPLKKSELMTCNETSRGNQIWGLDRVWPKSKMRNRLRTGFVGIIDEVALRIFFCIFGDDLYTVLVGADRAVRAQGRRKRRGSSSSFRS